MLARLFVVEHLSGVCVLLARVCVWMLVCGRGVAVRWLCGGVGVCVECWRVWLLALVWLDGLAL